MRGFIAALLLGACGALSALDAPPDGYELHEWGVFPLAPSQAWANCDMRAEWNALPAFIFRGAPLIPERVQPRGNIMAPAAKPVLFFYAQKAQTVKLSIHFTDGRALVWWPDASLDPRIDPQAELPILTFDLQLPDQASLANANWAQREAVPKEHWFENLRAVKATPIAPTLKRKGLHAEDFLYYDGITKAPAAPSVARKGTAVTLGTQMPFALLDTLVLERNGKTLRIAKNWIARIEPGAQSSDVEFNEVPEAEQAKRIEALKAEMIKRLEAAGLTNAEGVALVKTWSAGLFERQGLTFISRFPQETYEAWLPLKADPAPNKLVRVGLLVCPHLEPEREARMEALIKQLAAEDFNERNAAQKALSEYGGAAFDLLKKHLQDADAETAKACRNIFNALELHPSNNALRVEKK